MSRILVTGGAGFIGSHVIETLLKLDHTVMLIDDLSSGNINNLPPRHPLPDLYPNLHLRLWDILDLRLMDVIFHNFEPEAVIHLAAQPSIQESWKKADYDAKVNILGTINLLGLCQKYKVKRFVFASTSAVYSPSPSGIYDESCPVRPQTPYGTSKMAAERYIMISGISYAILRLGNVYGPRQVPLGENQLIPRYLAHVFQGTDFVVNGDGEQRRDFIYVKDVANAFLKAVESDARGIFNIGSCSAFSVKGILGMIASMIDKAKLNWKHGPAKKDELRKVLLGNRKATQTLGWKPEIDIIKGLRETIDAWPK